MTWVKWTQEELVSLESIAGSTYPPKVRETYNRWAKKSGYPVRSGSSILSACSRYKISRQAECDFLTSGSIAKILGIAIDAPQRWAERKYIESVSRGSKGVRYFRRSDIVSLARRQPDLFGGIERDRLFMLLEDSDLASSIASGFTKRKGSGRPILAVESGIVYQSVTAASRQLYATRQGIHSAIRSGGTCAGFHWKRI